MNAPWGVIAIYVLANLQYVECIQKERRPPPVPPGPRCWTCSRRIFSNDHTNYCIRGNFKDDVANFKRQATRCRPRQFCMVKYKISDTGAKTISRLCSDDNLNLCRTESTPFSNSTVCYKSCEQNHCNTQPSSSFQDALTTTQSSLTSAAPYMRTTEPTQPWPTTTSTSTIQTDLPVTTYAYESETTTYESETTGPTTDTTSTAAISTTSGCRSFHLTMPHVVFQFASCIALCLFY